MWEWAPQIDDLPDDALNSIFTMCGARGMADGACTCRAMATAAQITGKRLFSSVFGLTESDLSYIIFKPRSQLFKLVDRARSHLEHHQQEVFSWAAAHGFSEFIGRKLPAESDILRGRMLNYRNIDGSTPLFLATKHHRYEVVKTLLSYKAEVNPLNPRRLPLLQACKMSDVDLVRLLVDAKAEAIARLTPISEGVLSPLHVAVSNPSNASRLECLRVICASLKTDHERESCCARMSFLSVCESGDMPYLELLTEYQVGMKTPVEEIWRRRGSRFDGATPLLIAAQAGNANVAEYLLSAKIGGDINAVLTTNKTALYLCAERGNAYLAKVLLSKFASLDVQTCTGRSALFAAVEHCHEETVQVLCEFIDVRHITMRTKGEEGVSPFMLAEKRGKTSLIIPMLEAYHRAVHRRQLLRSFGDVIDDVTHPYLTKKVEQYRHLMFQARGQHASAPSSENSSRYRRVTHQRVAASDGKILRLDTQLDLQTPTEDASPRRRPRPASAPRVLSRSVNTVFREGRNVNATRRQSILHNPPVLKRGDLSSSEFQGFCHLMSRTLPSVSKARSSSRTRLTASGRQSVDWDTRSVNSTKLRHSAESMSSSYMKERATRGSGQKWLTETAEDMYDSE